MADEVVISEHLIGIPVIGLPDTEGGSQHQDGKQRPIHEGRERFEGQPATKDAGQRDQRDDYLQSRQQLPNPGIVDAEEGVPHRILRGQQPVACIEDQGREYEDQDILPFPTQEDGEQDRYDNHRTGQPPSERDQPEPVPTSPGENRA